MPKYDFLVAGTLTVDFLVKTRHIERIDISGHSHHAGGKDIEQLICISFGSKTDLEDLELFPGGSAANSAATMQLLGSRCALLAAVGNDDFGRIALKDVEKYGVDISHAIINKSVGTGVGINITAPSGEKSLLVYRGANSGLGPEHLKEELVKESRHIFLTSLASNSNFSLFLKILKLAKKHRKPVVFAPSISMLRRWVPQLQKLSQTFSVCVLNFEEGSFLTGQDSLKGMLRKLPGRVNVVSKDVEGAYARSKEQLFHVKPLPVRIVDTIGAGDAFSGAFAHYYGTAGSSVGDALKKAVCVAGFKLTHQGSRLPPLKGAAARFLKGNESRLRLERLHW